MPNLSLVKQLKAWDDASQLKHLTLSDLETILGLEVPYEKTDIERRYRRVSRDIHPDHFPEEDRADASDAFTVLAAIKEYLVYTKDKSQEVTNNPFYEYFENQSVATSASSGLFEAFNRRFSPLTKIFEMSPPHVDKTIPTEDLTFKELLCRYYWDAKELTESEYDALVQALKGFIEQDKSCLKATVGKKISESRLLSMVVFLGDVNFLTYLLDAGDTFFVSEGKWNNLLTNVVLKRKEDILALLRARDKEHLRENLSTILRSATFDRNRWKTETVQFLIELQDPQISMLDDVKGLVRENPTLLRHLTLFPCMTPKDRTALIYEVLVEDFTKYRFLSIDDRANPLMIALAFHQASNRAALYKEETRDPFSFKTYENEKLVIGHIPVNKIDLSFLVALHVVWPDLHLYAGVDMGMQYDNDSDKVSDAKKMLKQALNAFSYKSSRNLHTLIALEVCAVIALVAAVTFLPYTLPIAATAVALTLTSMALLYGLKYFYSTLNPAVDRVEENLKKAGDIRGSALRRIEFFNDGAEKPEQEHSDTKKGLDTK